MERRHSLTVTWGDEAVGLVINGGRVVDVFTGGLLEAGAAIAEGFVAGLGKGREGRERLDAEGASLVPGWLGPDQHSVMLMARPPLEVSL